MVSTTYAAASRGSGPGVRRGSPGTAISDSAALTRSRLGRAATTDLSAPLPPPGIWLGSGPPVGPSLAKSASRESDTFTFRGPGRLPLCLAGVMRLIVLTWSSLAFSPVGELVHPALDILSRQVPRIIVAGHRASGAAAVMKTNFCVSYYPGVGDQRRRWGKAGSKPDFEPF